MNVFDNLSEILHAVNVDNTAMFEQSECDMQHVLRMNGYGEAHARRVASRMSDLKSVNSHRNWPGKEYNGHWKNKRGRSI